MLAILFWVFLLLSVLGAFAPSGSPWLVNGRYGMLLVLILLVGLKVFGSPLR